MAFSAHLWQAPRVDWLQHRQSRNHQERAPWCHSQSLEECHCSPINQRHLDCKLKTAPNQVKSADHEIGSACTNHQRSSLQQLHWFSISNRVTLHACISLQAWHRALAKGGCIISFGRFHLSSSYQCNCYQSSMIVYMSIPRRQLPMCVILS